MADLAGKVGIVPGGGSGIGRATAVAMAKAGASLVIGNRDASAGGETVRLVALGGGKALFQKTDASKPADVKALVERGVGVRAARPGVQQRGDGRPAGAAARAGRGQGV